MAKYLAVHDIMMAAVNANGLSYRFFANHDFPGLLDAAINQNPKAAQLSRNRDSVAHMKIRLKSPVGARYRTNLVIPVDSNDPYSAGLVVKNLERNGIVVSDFMIHVFAGGEPKKSTNRLR